MSSLEQLDKNVSLIEQKVRYTFNDKTLLQLAFVHRSFANENKAIIQEHNERLEFLGDAILGMIVSDFLYEELPTYPEGELSYLRSRLVEASSCARYVQKIEISSFLLLGRGEAMNKGKGRNSILADLFEAVIGALHLDGGIKVAQAFFFDHFQSDVLEIIKQPHRNWKAELQDFCQKTYHQPPTYRVLKEEGPDHLKMFYILVMVKGQELGKGDGSSKKEAEQMAAEDAIKKLGLKARSI
ncbi:MAG: ribonuclease III [Chlamydiota bacterium]